jgi:cellobiose-specific phosphotransferase system component IIA
MQIRLYEFREAPTVLTKKSRLKQTFPLLLHAQDPLMSSHVFTHVRRD